MTVFARLWNVNGCVLGHRAHQTGKQLMAIGRINGAEIQGKGTVLLSIVGSVEIDAVPRVRFIFADEEDTEGFADGVFEIRRGGQASSVEVAESITTRHSNETIVVSFVTRAVDESMRELTYTILK